MITSRTHVATTLFAFVLLLGSFVGCDPLAKKFDKNFVAKEAYAAVVEEANATCPRRLNSYATLVGVKYSFGEVSFNYRVGEAGRAKVQCESSILMENLVLREAVSQSVRDLMTDSDLKTYHVFRDVDDRKLMVLTLDKYDVRRAAHEEFDKLDITSAFFPSDPFAGDYAGEIKNLGTKISRRRVNSLFDSLHSKCPQRVNDHATLLEVRTTGKCRFEYHYELDPEGTRHVHEGIRDQLQRGMAESMNGTRIGDAILKWDLRVNHIYRSYDGEPVLSFPITRNELMEVRLRGRNDFI